MQTTPDTTAVKISEKLQPMQFLKLSCPRYFCSIITWKWKLENPQLCVIVRRTILSSNSRLWDAMITLNIENTGKRSSDAPFLENKQLIKTMFQILWSPGILDLQPSDCKNRRRSDFKAPASESNSTPQISWGLPSCGTQNRKTHKIAKQNISHNFEKTPAGESNSTLQISWGRPTCGTPFQNLRS